MTIEEKLEKIRQLQIERNRATKELREQVMELERQSDTISEPYDIKIEELMKEIKNEVIKNKEPFENERAKITYHDGYVIDPSAKINWKY